jgi:hypothetical protein
MNAQAILPVNWKAVQAAKTRTNEAAIKTNRTKSDVFLPVNFKLRGENGASLTSEPITVRDPFVPVNKKLEQANLEDSATEPLPVLRRGLINNGTSSLEFAQRQTRNNAIATPIVTRALQKCTASAPKIMKNHIRKDAPITVRQKPKMVIKKTTRIGLSHDPNFVANTKLRLEAKRAAAISSRASSSSLPKQPQALQDVVQYSQAGGLISRQCLRQRVRWVREYDFFHHQANMEVEKNANLNAKAITPAAGSFVPSYGVDLQNLRAFATMLEGRDEFRQSAVSYLSFLKNGKMAMGLWNSQELDNEYRKLSSFLESSVVRFESNPWMPSTFINFNVMREPEWRKLNKISDGRFCYYKLVFISVHMFFSLVRPEELSRLRRKNHPASGTIE